MADGKKRAEQDERTVPLPVQTPSAQASAAPEPTQNRPPESLDPAREGSAIHGAPTHIGGSFDDEIEQRRVPPARPARAPTRVAVAEAAPTLPPPEPGAIEVALPPPPREPGATEVMPPPRPREPEPVGLYLGAPTVTAAGPAAVVATRTEPAMPAATHTTTEEEPPPMGLPTPTAPLPAGVPTAPLLAGTPTLELPASTVAPDDPTRLKLEAPARRRSRSWLVVVLVIALGGSATGIALRLWLHDRPVVAGPTPAPPAHPDPPATTPATAPAPVAPADLAPPPVKVAPPAAPVDAAPPPPTPTSEPEPALPSHRPSPPLRAADGFGPFIDPSGAGLGAALGDAVRVVLGDALAGSRIGVKGEVRRALVADGAASVECALLIFDDAGQRATVRGAARHAEAGARREALLRQAVVQCARSVEGELRAGVEHARARR